ncbi:MAG: hypothetical protein G01um101470_820 [Parcubacteria group bacterium Gr01-1014_70]|nr:MAG: hypothetical protein G01um101470_820 [Parcubacteria group bacterium Gr01-1014_70]
MKYRFTLLHSLYHWTLKWAAHPYASWMLFFISFIESSVFLIPPDVLLIPMTLAEPKKWFRFAMITTVASVLGGIAGYYIGYWLWETIGQAVIAFYGLSDAMRVVQVKYEANAFAAIFTAALTPIPYKVFTITAGLFHISLSILIFASIIGRGLRFFAVAWLVGRYGNPVKEFIETYFDMITIAAAALLVGGFIVLRWLV